MSGTERNFDAARWAGRMTLLIGFCFLTSISEAQMTWPQPAPAQNTSVPNNPAQNNPAANPATPAGQNLPSPGALPLSEPLSASGAAPGPAADAPGASAAPKTEESNPILPYMRRPESTESAITGTDQGLAPLLEGVSDPQERQQITERYWDLCEKLAYYNLAVVFANDVETCIGRYPGGNLPSNAAALWISARRIADEQKKSARIDFIAEQYRFLQLLRRRTGSAEVSAEKLPFPVDAPTTAAYNLRVQEISKNRKFTIQARSLSQQIPLQFEALEAYRTAVTESLSAFAALYKTAGISDEMLLSALERHTEDKRDMLAAAFLYNRSIAAYVAQTVGPQIQGDRLLMTLNQPPKKRRINSGREPAYQTADTRALPTRSDNQLPEANKTFKSSETSSASASAPASMAASALNSPSSSPFAAAPAAKPAALPISTPAPQPIQTPGRFQGGLQGLTQGLPQGTSQTPNTNLPGTSAGANTLAPGTSASPAPISSANFYDTHSASGASVTTPTTASVPTAPESDAELIPPSDPFAQPEQNRTAPSDAELTEMLSTDEPPALSRPKNGSSSSGSSSNRNGSNKKGSANSDDDLFIIRGQEPDNGGLMFDSLDWNFSSVPDTQNQPMQTALVQTSPDQSVPAQTGQDQILPVQEVPVQMAPAQTAPAQTAPVQAAPAEMIPAQTVPAQTAPAQMVPAQQASAQQVSAQSASSQPVPAQTVPNQNAPLRTPSADPAAPYGGTAASANPALPENSSAPAGTVPTNLPPGMNPPAGLEATSAPAVQPAAVPAQAPAAVPPSTASADNQQAALAQIKAISPILYAVDSSKSGAGDAGIVEIPISLTETLSQIQDPGRRQEAVEAYWRLRTVIAALLVETKIRESADSLYQRLQSASQATPEYDALLATWRAAMAASDARIALTRGEIRADQVMLMRRANRSPEAGWPIPRSIPCFGPYRLESDGARKNFMLMTESVLIPDRIDAVWTGAQMLGSPETLFTPEFNGINTVDDAYLYLRTLENKRIAARAFLENVEELNNSIARYVGAFSETPLPAATYVQCLIGEEK